MSTQTKQGLFASNFIFLVLLIFAFFAKLALGEELRFKEWQVVFAVPCIIVWLLVNAQLITLNSPQGQQGSERRIFWGIIIGAVLLYGLSLVCIPAFIRFHNALSIDSKMDRIIQALLILVAAFIWMLNYWTIELSKTFHAIERSPFKY